MNDYNKVLDHLLKSIEKKPSLVAKIKNNSEAQNFKSKKCIRGGKKEKVKFQKLGRTYEDPNKLVSRHHMLYEDYIGT
jgi:hypothetical protein